MIGKQENNNATNNNVSNNNIINNSGKTMYCTSSQKSSEYDETYTHIMYFENNICAKYEMKVERQYHNHTIYLKYKATSASYETFDDNTLTSVSMLGDGHLAINGNEEIYHSKTLEQAKSIAESYGNVCEVR